MAFTRSSEPFQEPPQRRSRSPLIISVLVLFLFFVPLLVVSAAQSDSPPAQASADPRTSATAQTSPSAAAPTRPAESRPVPPLPPPGAPWPPPPGAPQPPVCSLVYRVTAAGATVWTAMTTLSGRLAVEGAGHRAVLGVPVAVRQIALPTPLAQDHGLQAVLVSSGGRTADCVVGLQREL